MAKKDVPIRYTSRDYDSIRNDLLDHAKRYYSSNYKDFNEATFGAMMVDAVAYIGDILSFYTDYQANESFFDTAIEYENVVKQARQLGYKFNYTAIATGKVDIFLSIPANSMGGIDSTYLPVLKRGTTMSAGNNTYTLMEDVDFGDTDLISQAVGTVNQTTGLVETFAVRATGKVISGELSYMTYDVGNFQKFLSVDIENSNVVEVLEVMDSEGHKYVEVENLAQNVVYKAIKSKRSDKNLAPYLLKPFMASRRFTVEKSRFKTTLQFGHGSDSEIKNPSVADPSDVILDVYGKEYVTDPSFDPAKLNSTDKFGIAPANTTLSISYRVATSENMNAAPGAITQVGNAIFEFDVNEALTGPNTQLVRGSIEVNNPEAIVGDSTLPSLEELKMLAKNHFAAQNRAVTKQDYISLTYAMPSKFGSVKRASVVQDTDSFKRNLNLYAICQDVSNNLITATDTIKENLKTWLNNYKMINDTIDLLDAQIVNIGINFSIVGERNIDPTDLLLDCRARLTELYADKFNIGEPLSIAEVYQTLNRVEGVVDTTDVTVVKKSGTNYADTNYNVDEHISEDGRLLLVPQDTILEIKFMASDIVGDVIGKNVDVFNAGGGTTY